MTLFSKLKQIQDLKHKANELKSMLSSEVAEVDNDGVKIVIDGNQEILEIKISEELLANDKKERLEKILKSNFNDAIKKVQKMMAEKIKSSGFQMPNF